MKKVQKVAGLAARLVRESDLGPLVGKIARVTLFAGLMFLLASFFPALATGALVASVAVTALAGA
jgi:hypothetical protein